MVARLRPEVMPTVHGFSLRIPRYDRSPYVLELFLDREYEPEETRLIRSCLRPGDTAFDIGANVGYMTCLMARAIAPGTVHAFEPEQRHFEILQENLRLNALANVVVQRLALGAAPGEGVLYLSPDNLGDHSLVRLPNRSSQPIELTSVDVYRRSRCHGTSVRLVKIDVQGFEMKVLRGMRESLEERAVENVLVELYPSRMVVAGDSITQLPQWLSELPYQAEIVSQSFYPQLASLECIARAAAVLEKDPNAVFNVLLRQR
jgi:FkbM family methyltransferase